MQLVDFENHLMKEIILTKSNFLWPLILQLQRNPLSLNTAVSIAMISAQCFQLEICMIILQTIFSQGQGTVD